MAGPRGFDDIPKGGMCDDSRTKDRFSLPFLSPVDGLEEDTISPKSKAISRGTGTYVCEGTTKKFDGFIERFFILDFKKSRLKGRLKSASGRSRNNQFPIKYT